MTRTVYVLDSSGDVQITWDPANPKELEDAVRAVMALEAQGYALFLVDGSPAPDVVSGGGTLHCRRVKAAELLQPAPADQPAAPVETSTPAAAPGPRKRGRKATSESQPPAQTGSVAVATRPLRGG